MKTRSLASIIRPAARSSWRPVLAGGALLLVAGVAPLLGQAAPSLEGRFTGGGGYSTNGVYSLAGTLGQPDAGPEMSGGLYSLRGGLWATRVVQTPVAPSLRIFLASSRTVVVAWPAPSTGWVLEHCSDLAFPDWKPAEAAVSVVGNENHHLISSSDRRFYRLAKTGNTGGNAAGTVDRAR